MKFIENLYYGNINPNERRIEKDSQYEALAEFFCKNEILLAEKLSEDTLMLFNDTMSAKDQINEIENLESFKMGFVLGVQMMTECGGLCEKNMLEYKLKERD